MSSKPKPTALRDAPNRNDAAWLLERVWKRMNVKNEHFVGVFVGQEGAGKSHTAIKVAEMLDATFDTGEQVLFYLEDFLEILVEEEYDAGDVFVLDEAGVSLGNRSWQDRAQILGNQALQLIRDHNVGLIFTLPKFQELDKQSRGRVQMIFEILRKEPDEYVAVRPHIVDPDRIGRGNTDDYKKYPRRTNERVNGIKSRVRVKRIEFSPPSEAVLGGYSDRKREFQKQHYKQTIAELRGETGDDDALDDPTAIAEDILENQDIETFKREINNGTQVVFDKHKIKIDYGIGEPKAKQVKRIVTEEVDDDII